MVLKYQDGRGHKWSDGLSGEVELPSTDDADSVNSEPASPAKKCRLQVKDIIYSKHKYRAVFCQTLITFQL